MYLTISIYVCVTSRIVLEICSDNLPADSLMKRMIKAEAYEGFNFAPGGKQKCITT